MTDIIFCGQIAPNEISGLDALGVRWVVNHRPDHEEPGQPTSEDLARAAEAAGVSYVHAPVRGMPDADAVTATSAVLEAMKPGDKAVFFCRSGMRSAAAWAMAEASRGGDPDRLRAKALEAGYDLGRLPL